MRVPITFGADGELVLARPGETAMYLEVDDRYAAELAEAPVGTPIRIDGGDD